jgi:hypothetical protein
MAISGGCQCGVVRYRIDGALGDASICHCRMCQKAFGNFAAPLVSVARSSLTWTRGGASEFRSSSIVSRGFCRDCGTPLYMLDDGSESYDLAICTLDDPNLAPPTKQVGVEAMVHWFKGLAELPGTTTDSYNSPEQLAKYKSRQHPDHDTEHWP